MKLIEILVEELPKRGGWPEFALALTQDGDGSICLWEDVDVYQQGGAWAHPSGTGLLKYWCNNKAMKPAEDRSKAIITREQYEAALAASKPEWDGEGLPPVGSKVSFFYNERYDYNEEIIPQDGQELEVVAHKTTTDEHDVAVCYWDENGGGMAVCLVPGSLRPIRSEADKKRAEGVIALSRVDPNAAPFEYGDKHTDGSLIGPFWYELYDAIAAGKIPHIRIN